MMKAALKYYKSSHDKKPAKITLGQFQSRNSSSALGARLTTKTRRPKKIEFTEEEKALLRLVNNGQMGALMAQYAPKEHSY